MMEISGEWYQSLPNEDDVNDFGADVQPLIKLKACAAFTFNIIDQPVYNEFDESEQGTGGDSPNGTGLDEAVYTKSVNPQSWWDGVLSASRRLEAPVLGDGKKFSL